MFSFASKRQLKSNWFKHQGHVLTQVTENSAVARPLGLVAVQSYQGLCLFLSHHSAALSVSFVLGLAPLAVINWMLAAMGSTYFLIIRSESITIIQKSWSSINWNSTNQSWWLGDCYVNSLSSKLSTHSWTNHSGKGDGIIMNNLDQWFSAVNSNALGIFGNVRSTIST